MSTTTPTERDILDAAATIVVGDQTDALSYSRLAHRLGSTIDAVRAVYPVFETLVASLLTRETAMLTRVIVDNVDRDPRGGLPSRIFSYALCAVYEQPLARALYLDDPAGLARIVRMTDGVAELPTLSLHPDLLPELQRAGMMRADIAPARVAAVIDVAGAGIAMSAPRQQLDAVAAGLRMLLERAVDADVVDTTPGKALLARYTATVAL